MSVTLPVVPSLTHLRGLPERTLWTVGQVQAKDLRDRDVIRLNRSEMPGWWDVADVYHGEHYEDLRAQFTTYASHLQPHTDEQRRATRDLATIEKLNNDFDLWIVARVYDHTKATAGEMADRYVLLAAHVLVDVQIPVARQEGT